MAAKSIASLNSSTTYDLWDAFGHHAALSISNLRKYVPPQENTFPRHHIAIEADEW